MEEQRIEFEFAASVKKISIMNRTVELVLTLTLDPDTILSLASLSTSVPHDVIIRNSQLTLNLKEE